MKKLTPARERALRDVHVTGYAYADARVRDALVHAGLIELDPQAPDTKYVLTDAGKKHLLAQTLLRGDKTQKG